jgi:hypothetical protein
MRTLLAMLALTALASAAAQTSKPETGDLWEITMKMDMPGVPAGAMAPRTSQSCQPKPKERGKEPPQPQMGDGKDCKVSDASVRGETRTWKFTCADGASGTGRITAKGPDAWESESELLVAGQTMKSTMSGRRVGDCQYRPLQVPPSAPAKK